MMFNFVSNKQRYVNVIRCSTLRGSDKAIGPLCVSACLFVCPKNNFCTKRPLTPCLNLSESYLKVKITITREKSW